MSNKQEKRINSIRDVDLSDLKLPFIVAYDNPKDYPGKCVARIFDTDTPTDTVTVKGSFLEIRDDIQKNTHMCWIPRGADDEPKIVGAWL